MDVHAMGLSPADSVLEVGALRQERALSQLSPTTGTGDRTPHEKSLVPVNVKRGSRHVKFMPNACVRKDGNRDNAVEVRTRTLPG